MKKKLLILSSSLVLALLFFVFTGKAVSFADLTFTSFKTGVKAIDFKWQSAYTIVGTLPDKSTIKFIDKNGAYDYYTGGTGEYTSDKPACASSHAIINATPGGTGASTSAGGQFRAQWLLGGAGTGNGGCQPETTTIINIGDGNNSKYTYEFSGTSIVNMNGGNKFNQDKKISSAGDVYSLVGTPCSSIIVYKNGTATFYPIKSSPTTITPAKIPYSPSCYLDLLGYGQIGYTGGTPNNTNANGGFVIPVLGTPGSSPSVPIPASTGSTSNSGGGPTSSEDCLSSGGPLSWITCAVFDGITGLESTIENEVASLLKVTPINFSTTCSPNDNSGCIFNVWANFRIYGNLFLIIALLIAVLVEAIGGGMVANYTIKKMIPRILVAVILINLSIYVVAIMIDVFNILGAGVYDLIKQPFLAAGVWHIMVGGGTGILTTLAGGGAATLLLIGIIGDGIGFLLLTIAVPAILAVIGVLITIVIRQGLIIFLTITAPIAFALYCLPNTEQYFKKWWDLLIKTLVVYPVVMLVIAIANVTAVVFGSLSSDNSWNQILGIIAGIIPLFLIPFAFKISGGVISQVSGMTKKGADWANKSLRGDPRDPNSRYNTARRRAQAGREQNGTSVGAIGTRLRHGGGGAAIRRSARTGAAGAQELASNPINEQWKGNADYNDAGIIMSAMATGAMSRQQGEFELNRLATANGGAAAGAVAAARQIRQSAGTGDAFLAQKVAAGYGYNTDSGEDPGIGHDRLVRDVARSTGCDYTTDAQGRTVLDTNDDNYGVASQKLIAAKGALGAAGFGHLGDTSVEYNPIKAVSRQDKTAYLNNKPSAFIAQGQGAAEAASKPGAGVAEYAAVAQAQEELQGIISSATASPDQRTAATEGLGHITSFIAGDAGYQAFAGSAAPGGVAGPPSPAYTQAVAQARRASDDVRVVGGLPPAPPTPPPAPPAPPTPPPAPPAPPTPPTYPRWSDDIIDIDSSGRPRTPSGKFMSYENADVAEANADLIRDNLPPKI